MFSVWFLSIFCIYCWPTYDFKCYISSNEPSLAFQFWHPIYFKILAYVHHVLNSV
jgi:hypothetical protein